jgi:cytochrome c-type biogenesis protein CcsB
LKDLTSYFIGDPILGLGLLAFFVLLISLPISFWSVAGDRNSSFIKFLIAIANISLTCQLILRWLQSGHFPISNLYESLCFLTWGCTLTQLFVERAWKSPIVSAVATPISLLSIGFASFVLPENLQSSAPLVPALRSSWLIMHVSVIMSSYAALLIGSILSFGVFLVDGKKQFNIRNSSFGSGSFRQSSEVYLNGRNENLNSLQPVEFTNAEQLDSLSYRSITAGFLLLTVGLISGAVWANEAWGSWWSWDPKETWALICWLVYAAYLHTRITRGWQGKKPALLAITGFFLIIVCYIGVNLLGVGLHSYGWFFDA